MTGGGEFFEVLMPYAINEFESRYECNAKGGIWKPGDPKRSGPLPYLRAPVHGKNWTMSYREFNAVCGPIDAPAAYGVFCKLREIQADSPVEHRDILRDHRGEPLDLDAIVLITGWDYLTVSNAIQLLCSPKIGWLRELPESAGNSAEFRASRARAIRSESDHNQINYIAPNPDGISEPDQTDLFEDEEEEVEEKPERSNVPFTPSKEKFFLATTGPYNIRESDVYAYMPVRGCHDDRGWPLFKEHIKAMVDTYAHSDNERSMMAKFLVNEMTKARMWLISNPAKQKTPRGMAKFLNSWVERAFNNRGVQ